MPLDKTIAIHQPNYIPWLGYFYKIYQSDIFVFLDDVQFTNEGMQNYHYIKTPQGSFRLKIPVNKHFGQLIKDVRVKEEMNWKDKHLRTLEMNYKKAPFFDVVFMDLSMILNHSEDNLSKLDTDIIKFISGKFGFKTHFKFSSELNLQSVKADKVIEICKYFDASVYYSGTGARAYQNEEDFKKNNITLRYSTFTPFEYPQLWGNFQSNVSIIDFLMNCGYNWEMVLENQNRAI